LELLPRLQNVFKALDSLLGGASTLNILESSEVIRIAAVDNTAMVFIMPFLKELHQRAPKLGIEIVPLGSQSAAGLGSGAVDFMYACDPHLPADPSLRQRLLLAAPHCVLVRKDHPLCEVPDGIVGPEELARYPMVIPTVSQPSGLNAMIMPFHEISSQRFLQSPFFLANAWSLLDSDGYTIHPIPLAEILTERLPLAALKPKDIVIPPWVPHLYWSVRTDADPLRQWVRSFLISCAGRRWSRYCSDDEAGWREAMASLEAASICSVCSE
ncbi:LysR substrate-binding domain-containing protein, partial [Sutterella wadsworthensis]